MARYVQDPKTGKMDGSVGEPPSAANTASVVMGHTTEQSAEDARDEAVVYVDFLPASVRDQQFQWDQMVIIERDEVSYAVAIAKADGYCGNCEQSGTSMVEVVNVRPNEDSSVPCPLAYDETGEYFCCECLADIEFNSEEEYREAVYWEQDFRRFHEVQG